MSARVSAAPDGHELPGSGMARTLVESGYLSRLQLLDPGMTGTPAQRGAP